MVKYFLSDEDGERRPKFVLPFKLRYPIIGTLIAFVIFESYFTVQPYEAAVVTRLGAIERTAGPGFNMKIPFIESVRMFRTDITSLTATQPVNTYTIDNQEVDVSFNVFYRIPSNKIAVIYRDLPDFHQRLFTLSVDRLKAEMGRVNVSSVAEKRGELRDAIKTILQRDAALLGLEVTDFALTNLEYNKSFREAVSNAAVQKANVESLEYQRQQALKAAESAAIKAVGEANAARESARGRADAVRLEGQAEADSNLAIAKAKAEGTKLQGMAEAAVLEAQQTALAVGFSAQADALQGSPELVELRKAERWNGALPTQVFAGAPIPFFDTKRP